MKPTEAIEILEIETGSRHEPSDPELNDAMNLGIEALKFRLRWEEQEGEDDFPLLPGETKE